MTQCDSNVDSSSSISSSLLIRVRGLDSDAWRRLVQIYGPLVYRWCTQAGVAAADAEDIGQEVFRAVLRGIDAFRRERASDTFAGWLRVITRRKIVDFWRAKNAYPTAPGGSDFVLALGEIPQPVEAASANLEDDSRVELYQRALRVLKADFHETSWRAFWRTTIDGCESQQVADELGMSAMAVRKAKSRVLRRLREEFRDML